MSELREDMSREYYDALKRVNWSRLRLMGKSPAHYFHGGTRDSAALKLGGVAHLLTLEPHLFEARYIVNDENRNSNAFKAVKAFAEQAGKVVLKQAEVDDARRIADAIRNNKDAAALLSKGRAEVSCLWELAGDGFSFECKARLDWLCEDGTLVELKTCRDASPRRFGRQAAEMGYCGQLAWYERGRYSVEPGRRVERVPVVIAVESDEPYPVTVFEVGPRELALGWDRCAAYLGKLSECQRLGKWPGYAEGRVPLQLPQWAMETFEEEEAA